MNPKNPKVTAVPSNHSSGGSTYTPIPTSKSKPQKSTINPQQTPDIFPDWLENIGANTAKIVSVVHKSVDIQASGGFGIGLKQNLGIVSANAKIVPYGGTFAYEYRDGLTDTTKGFDTSIGAVFSGVIGAEISLVFATPTEEYFKYGFVNPPSGKWLFNESISVLNSKYTNFNGENNDTSRISFGQGAYFIVGGEYEIGISINKFKKEWRKEFN